MVTRDEIVGYIHLVKDTGNRGNGRVLCSRWLFGIEQISTTYGKVYLVRPSKSHDLSHLPKDITLVVTQAGRRVILLDVDIGIV
jgi:hypothetical protein